MDDFLFVLMLVALLAVAGGVAGVVIGEGITMARICNQSGFDSYKYVNGTAYCYIGKDMDIVFVPLLVTMPEEINDGR